MKNDGMKMTVQDALIDRKAPLADRAMVLINDVLRQQAEYNLKSDFVVGMGVGHLPYIIPATDDPRDHQAEIEKQLRLKDEAAAARRNQPVHPFFSGPRRAGR